MFNVKYDTLLGTNANAHIRTVQVVALCSSCHAKSNICI